MELMPFTFYNSCIPYPYQQVLEVDKQFSIKKIPVGDMSIYCCYVLLKMLTNATNCSLLKQQSMLYND